MANELKAVEHTVEVIFDPAPLTVDPFTYRLDGGKASPILSCLVGANLALFRFSLTTKGDPADGAVLTSNPIQWLSSSRMPISMPSSFFFQRTNDLDMIVVNLNQVTETGVEVPFGFEIAVIYQGRTHTSPDPTIINVQPPPATPETPGSEIWREPQERPAPALVS